MDKGVWKEAVRENANEKGVRSCNRCKGGVCSEEGKGVSVIERREGGDKRICERAVVKGIYLAVEVTANSASIFCGKERQEEMDGAES